MYLMYFALLLLAPLTQSHFILQYPSSLGFDDDIESTEPCGGFKVVFDKTKDTRVQVGGSPVAVLSTHPQAQWLYRSTTSTSTPYNWTDLMPVVQQTGLGHFCLPAVKAPSEFAGKQGLIQITSSTVDGMLYQCAAVNFVSGQNTTVGSPCTNSTGVTASLTDMSGFPNSSSSPSGTTAAAAATSTGAATGLSAFNGFNFYLLPLLAFLY